MEIKIIDPNDYPGWNEILLTNDRYSFFYSSVWSKVLEESYKYKPVYFTCINNGKLSALVPIMSITSFITGKRGVSLPFSDYCQPIAPDESQFQKVFERITEFGRSSGWKYFECRGGTEYLDNKPPSLCFFTHSLDLSVGEKMIFSGLRNSTKRNIKKAFKNGVTIDIYKSMDSIKEFYKLNFITRKNHGLPPQPFFFFKKIYEHIISRGFGFIVLASYQGKKIAGAICFHFGDKAIYKFGAYNRDYQELRPNNPVIWHAIKWYAQQNYKYFDFGITGSRDTGLRQFKLGWGVNENIINYYRYNLSKNKFIKDNFRTKESYQLFKKLPSPVLLLTGSFLYRHVG